MKQLELDLTDCTPTFKEWLAETNHEHSMNSEKDLLSKRG